jgi:hypothetical protein
MRTILPPLKAALDATPRRLGVETFLYTEWGKSFTEAGLGGKMREWCDQAGLPECTSHGLKKAAATIVAELGGTDRMMMALFDWMSEREATTYTKKANRTRLAAGAAKLPGTLSWERFKNGGPAAEAV